MHKKEKNIINRTDSDSLAGRTEVILKANSARDNINLKTGRSQNALPEDMADIKTGGTSNRSTASGDKTYLNTGPGYSALSRKLYMLILIGLCAAVLLLLAGFFLDFFNGSGSLSLENLQEQALTPAGLIYSLNNNQMPASLLISYAGLLAIIFVPAAGLIYIIGYFTYRKKYNLALTAAGVLFILILSAVIGLLR
jgi:hypothetical protein